MRSLFFLLITFFLFQNCKDTTPQDQIDANFTAIIVSDMDASLKWYQEKLGFQTVDYNEVPERGLKQASLSVGSNRLELIYLESLINADSTESAAQTGLKLGLFKTGFNVTNFDQFLQNNLDIDAGDERIVVDSQTNQRMIVIKDPDGNRIQLFEN